MSHAPHSVGLPSRITTNASAARQLRTRSGAATLLLGGAALFAHGCGDLDPYQYNCTITGVVDDSTILKCVNSATNATPPAPGSGRSADAGSAEAAGPHSRRHVILLIGDGMGYAHQVAASRYRHGIDGGLSFQQFPVQAFVTTWSVGTYNALALAKGAPLHTKFAYDATLGYDPALGGSAPYPMLPDPPTAHDYFLPGGFPGPRTDSAAAATAMATGFKTLDEVVGLDADGGMLESSIERLRRTYGQGIGIGVVTTAPLSDATPAAFVSHISSRSLRTDIASQMVHITRPDVVIAGGFRGVDPSAISEGDVATLKTASDTVYLEPTESKDGDQAVRHAASLATRGKQRLWGLFGSTGFGFESPVAVHSPDAPTFTRQSTADPTLPTAVTEAMRVLADHEDGFFLVVEQGSIDKFSHQGDFAAMVGCVSELDDTVKAVVNYVDNPDDAVDWSNTTVLVTADHETGYLRFADPQAARGELPAAGAYSWTGDHSNQLVTLSAKGAYAHRVLAYTNEYTGLPILDDTSVYAIVMDANER